MVVERRFLNAKAIEKQKRMDKNYAERLAQAKEINKKAKDNLTHMNSVANDLYNHPGFKKQFDEEHINRHMQSLLLTNAFPNPAFYERILKKRVADETLRKELVEKFKNHSLVDKAFKLADTPEKVRALLKNPEIRKTMESIDPEFLIDEVGRRNYRNEIDLCAGSEWDKFFFDLRDAKKAKQKASESKSRSN